MKAYTNHILAAIMAVLLTGTIVNLRQLKTEDIEKGRSLCGDYKVRLFPLNK